MVAAKSGGTMSQELQQRVDQLERQLSEISKVFVLRSDGEAIPEEVNRSSDLAAAITALEPLKPLLEDDTINDILINSPTEVYVERQGKLEKTSVTFSSDEQVFAIASAIGRNVGRLVSSKKPLLDARLPDGSRVNVVVYPLALEGTAISIRKFSKRTITLDAMAAGGNISPSLAEFLKVVAHCRMNIIISGGTGSGKTTLLNAISEHIDPQERVVTIEDAAELKLQQPHVVRMETRPIRSDRREDEVNIRDLLKNSLRMRPDRILIGEVRGVEAFDMMQAMNTGHEGSITTIHANHPRDALSRLESMVVMANLNLPTSSIRAQLASALDIVIQVSRMRDGKRRVTFVSEVIGMESDVITMQDIFSFQSKGEGADGSLVGEFKWSGIMPRFLRRAAYYGQTDRLASALGVKLPKI